MIYALLETLASERQGHELWYAGMTGIGPMTTPEPSQRVTFNSEAEARRCPAMWHALSFFEPVEIGSPVPRERQADGP